VGCRALFGGRGWGFLGEADLADNLADESIPAGGRCCVTNSEDDAGPVSDPGELTIWFERLDPLRVRTYDDAPARDDYSNIYFVGTGKSRAHAGRFGQRPDCIPSGSPAHWSHDLWIRPLPPTIPRCGSCLARHPVDQVID
jgi:hypothetical protein